VLKFVDDSLGCIVLLLLLIELLFQVGYKTDLPLLFLAKLLDYLILVLQLILKIPDMFFIDLQLLISYVA